MDSQIQESMLHVFLRVQNNITVLIFNEPWNAHTYNINAEGGKRSGGSEFHILAWNEEDDRNEDKEGDGVGGAGGRADTGIGKEGAGDFEEATGVAGAVCRRSNAASRLFFFSDAAADASAADSTISGKISSPPHLQPMSSLPVQDDLESQFLSKRPLIVDNQVQLLAQIIYAPFKSNLHSLVAIDTTSDWCTNLPKITTLLSVRGKTQPRQLGHLGQLLQRTGRRNCSSKISCLNFPPYSEEIQ